jgi:hypothetical protein
MPAMQQQLQPRARLPCTEGKGMSEAPETIWAFYAPEIAEDNNGATIVAHEGCQHGAQKYRRADLPLTTDQLMADPRVKALVEAAERASIWQDRYKWAAPWADDLHFALAQLKEPKE